MVKHKCHQMFAVSSPSASIPLSVHIIYFIPVIYLVVSGWMKPCAPDCCSMREPSWTCGVQRRSMAIQSWIGGALSLCWSLRQAYCCRHIRPTTSQQRTTKLVLLRTFGVCSSTMTNARKTSMAFGGQRLLQLYRSYDKGAHRADMWRYIKLFLEGGHYLDIKCALYRPWNETMDAISQQGTAQLAVQARPSTGDRAIPSPSSWQLEETKIISSRASF